MISSGPGNLSDETNSFPFSEESIPMFMALLVLVFPVCILGNSLLIAVVHKNVTRRMRTTTNLFIVNMAISDILASLSIPVLTVLTLLSVKIRNSNNATELLIILNPVISCVWAISSGMSLLSLLVISMDRFWAVFFPTKRPLIRNKAAAFTTIWLFSISYSVAHTFSAFRTGPRSKNRFLFDFLYLSFIFIMALPTSAILVVYPAILIKLRQRKLPGNPSAASQALRDRTNRKVVIMVAVLIASFAVSWIPNTAYAIKVYLEPEENTISFYMRNRLFSDVTLVLSLIHPLWNPLVCFGVNENFRSEFKILCQTCCRCCSVFLNKTARKNTIINLTSTRMDVTENAVAVKVTKIHNEKN